MYNFLFSKPERHNVKVLAKMQNKHLCGEIFHTIAHALSTLFAKKKFFLDLTMFFTLRNKHIVIEVITFAKSTSQIKVMLPGHNFRFCRLYQ